MSGKSKTAKKQGKGFATWEIIAGVCLILLVIWAAYSVLYPSPSPTSSSLTSSSPGSPSPTSGPTQFTLQRVGPDSTNDGQVSLSTYSGDVIMLEFMEPWCPHCQNDAPMLQQLWVQYQTKGVVFISIAGNWNGATANDVSTFIKTYHTNWTYAYDSSGTTFTAYGITATPTFVFIGHSGNIATSHVGEMSSQDITNELNLLIQQSS